MQGIWKKLNLKEDGVISLINVPISFEVEVDKLKGVNVLRKIEGVNVLRKIEGDSITSFILAFVTSRSEIQNIANELISKTAGDVTVWFSYPKGTSKTYSCDLNRDNGWEPILELGFRGVRQVAIDEDWSALRFRRSEFVKSKK